MPNTRRNTLPDGTEAFSLDDFLPYQVSVLADTLSRSLARVYSQRFGITIPEWRVLVQLNNESPLTAQEVAYRTSMEKPRVSRALVRLNKSGLIERSQHCSDRRVALLALSRLGKKRVAEIIPYALAWQEKLRSTVGSDELQTLLDTSRKVTRVLREKPGRDLAQE